MIVDAHMHLGTLPNYFLPDEDAAAVLKLMDDLSIDYGIQMHMSGFNRMFEYAFNQSEEVFFSSGKRIFYGLIFDPTRPEESLRWIDQAVDREGCVCVKIHPSWHQVYADDDAYEQVWKYAQQHGKPVVSHTWAVSDYNPAQKFSTPEHFVRYIEQFPDVRLVMGHGGGRYEGLLRAMQIAKTHSNVLLDTSGDVNAYGLIKLQVGELGADRIVFGSDVNMMDPRGTMGKVLAADIPEGDKWQILGGNALREFHLPEGR